MILKEVKNDQLFVGFWDLECKRAAKDMRNENLTQFLLFVKISLA